MVLGDLEPGEPPKILLRDAFSVDDAETKLAARLQIELLESELSDDRLRALLGIVKAHRGDCAVRVLLREPGVCETEIALPETAAVDASDTCLRELNTLFGRQVAELDLS